MKKLLLLILINFLFINAFSQNYSFVIDKTYNRYWDLNTHKEIRTTDPVPVKMILTHKRTVDSLLWVNDNSTQSYKILPGTTTMREDNNRMVFIIDATNGQYATVIIGVNFGEWLKDNTYDLMKDAYIMMNPCTKDGDPISGKAGMKITVFTIKDIIQHK